jgi:hypothetical protein
MLSDRTWKCELLEKARPLLGTEEEVRVVALAQASVDPWLMFAGWGVGGGLLGGGLFGDTYLPTWVGILGLIAIIAMSWAFAFIPRRLLLRTDSRLFVFDLPRTRKRPLAPPLHGAPADELPPDPGKRSIQLCGERLWGNFGRSREREAISAALAPRPP